MKVNSEFSISHAKNCIRPTLYWECRKLNRQLYFLKQEIIKELGKNKILKYLLEKFL